MYAEKIPFLFSKFKNIHYLCINSQSAKCRVLEERNKKRSKYYPHFKNFDKIFISNEDKTVTLLRLQRAWELLLIWLLWVFGDTFKNR